MKKSLTSSLKRLVISILACLGIAFVLTSIVYSQSFWEDRQKRIEDMKKKELKQPPQDEKIVTPETKPVPQKEEELAPEYEEDEYAGEEDEYIGEEEPYAPLEEDMTIPSMEGLGALQPDEELGTKNWDRIIGPDDYINPEDIKISEEYGTIKDVRNAGKNKKTIIHIQDAHVNYDAQMSIAHLIEELFIKYGANVIMREGGMEDDVGMGTLKWTGHRKTRQEVINKYVKEGQFSGVDYIDAISYYPLLLCGLEDKKLYLESDTLQLAILNLKDDAKKQIDDIQLSLINLKAGVFSKKLQELDAKKKEYNEEKISLADYSTYLESHAKKINLKKEAPNFDKFLQTLALEKEIDFPSVDDERTQLIDELTKKSDKKTSDELVQKSLDFRQGALNAIDYYTYLKEQYKSDLAPKYPNLDKYITYITLHKSLDTHALFAEIDQVEWLIRKQYYESNDQEKLDLIARNLRILEGLIKLELTPDEYEYYRKNASSFKNVKSWVVDLDKMARKMGLTKRMNTDVRIIENAIPTLDQFYANTYARDEAFVKRTEAKFDTIKQNAVIVVTGGFHTPNLVALMRKKGYSYIVIAPKIDNPTQPGLYEKVIRESIQQRKNAGK